MVIHCLTNNLPVCNREGCGNRAVWRHRMSDIPDGYEYLGWYEPLEAKRLLEALELDDIGTYAVFQDGGRTHSTINAYGGFGGSQILIAIDKTRRPQVDRIHGLIFGSSLPVLPEGNDSPESWVDSDGKSEVETLERRQQLVDQIDEIERELKKLLREATVVNEELKDSNQTPERLESLRKAFERHRETNIRLQSDREKLECEVKEIDKALYGGEDEEGPGPGVPPLTLKGRSR